MTQDEAVNHWGKRARTELKAAHVLFEKKDSDMYGEVLFYCHLALELALKSAYIREHERAAPFTHDLNELANALERDLRNQIEDLEEITEYAVLARYGDEEWLRTKATQEKACEWLEKTERLIGPLLQT